MPTCLRQASTTPSVALQGIGTKVTVITFETGSEIACFETPAIIFGPKCLWHRLYGPYIMA